MTNNSFKSDVAAKAAYVNELTKRGFNAHVVKAPADIKAEKDGQIWYFEIKMTKHTDRYFGAATMTEWRQAFKDPEHFRFVIAIDLGEGNWKFIEYKPEELMRFSTIPPFKVYFTANLKGEVKRTSRSNAVRLTAENFHSLTDTYDHLNRG